MKDTQCQRIIQYMKDYGSITAAEAMSEFGCYRLAARISDLKNEGYEINRVMETGKNRYGDSVSYARYSLA